MFSVVNYSNGQQRKPIQFLASYHGGVTFNSKQSSSSLLESFLTCRRCLLRGLWALVDVRAEERTGRRNSVGGGQSLRAPQQYQRRSGAQRRLPPPRPPTPPLDPNINTTNKLIRMHMGWKPSLTPSNPVVAYLKSMNTKKECGRAAQG